MFVSFSNWIFPFVHGKVNKASPQRERERERNLKSDTQESRSV